MVNCLKNKKPFIHNRDEEFSPRYHPNSIERFEGRKLQVINLSTFKPSNFQTHLIRANGRTRG